MEKKRRNLKKLGKALRMAMPQLTLKDVLEMRSSDEFSLTTSPFGITPEQYERNPPIYVKRAVAWKNHPERMPAAVKSGLANAIKISKKYAGVRGTVIYQGKLYPRKSIEQKKG